MEISPDDIKLKQMEVLQRYFLDQQKPQKFNPYETDNILMQNESNFEEIIATMEDNGTTSAKGLTEYEFYSRLKFYEKKFKNGTGQQS
jgi:hypothetical protein